jgi:hypothetical protein
MSAGIAWLVFVIGFTWTVLSVRHIWITNKIAAELNLSRDPSTPPYTGKQVRKLYRRLKREGY